jgi:HK97 gp10 family phage protein
MAEKTYITGAEQVVTNLSKYSKNLVREVMFGCSAVQQKVVNDAQSLVPVWTGNLQGSIKPGDIKITDDDITAEVVANALYASYVEFGTGVFAGRKPFFPNVAALEDWAQAKLGDRSAAFAVAKSIAQKGGMKQRPFMAPALLQNINTFRNAMVAAVKRTTVE